MVVVMERGRIRQSGTPREIYRDPRSHFVASFIGDLNTLPARLSAVTAEGISIDVAGQRTTLPASAWRGGPPMAGAACILGFRPEDGRLDAADGLALPARSSGLAWTGATARIGLSVDGHPITVLAMAETLEGRVPNLGEPLPLSIPNERLLLFPAL
jgi:ABC-type Fe3+/spermidine/putrescine transport system ATPase subunit